MTNFDVFNGDADGICAIHQLRLNNPLDSTLVTGVKRDIKLLNGLEAGSGDQIIVLDISLDKNRDGLLHLLEQGAHITYFDHHFAGEIPEHTNLEVHIDTASHVCSSLLVNDYLEGKYLPWAVTAAFGDNLFDSAAAAAAPLGLDNSQLELLKELGTYINYNGYGATLEDLHFAPADLYRLIQPYENPFDFIEQAPAYQTLKQGYHTDIDNARGIKPELVKDKLAVYILPDASWARRVSGVFANQLAQDAPERAHAILSIKPSGGYLVSVRAPLSSREGADEVCRQFPTGGGRKAAAGINDLAQQDFDRLVAVMDEVF